MDAMLARTVASPRLYSATAAGFAFVAVALAALGLYGVLSYSIGTRTREFGIRLALGATGGSVIAGVMRDAARTVLPGVAAGLLGGLYLSRFLEALLFGVRPHDPATFAAVAILFLAVAALACYVPAHRAARVDPVVALRAE
jgi:ABC-type antimicrobial peptide transport system permease subunit